MLVNSKPPPIWLATANIRTAFDHKITNFTGYLEYVCRFCCFMFVFNRLMTRFMFNQSKYTLDSVLSKLNCPLLLLWGDLDPWVGPAKANRIKEFYPKTSLVNLQAGHCPHDEVPELVNRALLDWLSNLKPENSLQTVWTSKSSTFLFSHLIVVCTCNTSCIFISELLG